MATGSISLPPVAKASMIGIWIETVLYGVNCALYGLCIFVLLHGGKNATLRRTLIVASTVLFLLCTVHVGASLQQLLDGFVYGPPGVPDYSTFYFLNFAATPRIVKDILYDTLVLAQDVILIWRLYVVFAYNWRVIILPIILMAGCVGSAYAASIISTLPNRGLPVSNSLILSAWTCGFTLNATVTSAIAGRLWWMGRKIASLTATSTNRFGFSIYLVIESGAISAIANSVVLALYANLAALTGLDIASQVLALTPLLIIAQLGLTERYHIPSGDSSKTLATAQDGMVFRARVPEEQDLGQDIPLTSV